jgi:hypothetical protein
VNDADIVRQIPPRPELDALMAVRYPKVRQELERLSIERGKLAEPVELRVTVMDASYCWNGADDPKHLSYHCATAASSFFMVACSI